MLGTDRVVVPGAGGVRAQAAPVRRRRLARAADAARRGARLCGALRPWRRRAAGRPRALDARDQPRVGAHEPARRRPAAPRAARRRAAAGARSRSRWTRSCGEAVETAQAVEPDRAIALAAEHVVVLGDRDRLRQIVDNLLANVRAHTPAGTPVTVSRAARERRRRDRGRGRRPGARAGGARARLRALLPRRPVARPRERRRRPRALDRRRRSPRRTAAGSRPDRAGAAARCSRSSSRSRRARLTGKSRRFPATRCHARGRDRDRGGCMNGRASRTIAARDARGGGARRPRDGGDGDGARRQAGQGGGLRGPMGASTSALVTRRRQAARRHAREARRRDRGLRPQPGSTRRRRTATSARTTSPTSKEDVADNLSAAMAHLRRTRTVASNLGITTAKLNDALPRCAQGADPGPDRRCARGRPDRQGARRRAEGRARRRRASRLQGGPLRRRGRLRPRPARPLALSATGAGDGTPAAPAPTLREPTGGAQAALRWRAHARCTRPSRERSTPCPARSPASDQEPHRILLVGNETLASDDVVASLEERAAGGEVLVVAPALDGRRGRPPDDDRPRASPSAGSPRASTPCATAASPPRASSATPSPSSRSRTPCVSSLPTRS